MESWVKTCNIKSSSRPLYFLSRGSVYLSKRVLILPPQFPHSVMKHKCVLVFSPSKFLSAHISICWCHQPEHSVADNQMWWTTQSYNTTTDVSVPDTPSLPLCRLMKGLISFPVIADVFKTGDRHGGWDPVFIRQRMTVVGVLVGLIHHFDVVELFTVTTSWPKLCQNQRRLKKSKGLIWQTTARFSLSASALVWELDWSGCLMFLESFHG